MEVTKVENNKNYEINIVHLYPDLLNLYGDKGNISCIENRLSWRGIKMNVIEITSHNRSVNFKNADIIFVGGGSDREQEIVCKLLLEKQDELKSYVEDNGVLVAVCGGYQLLGKYYKTATTKIEGLDILDIYTEAGDTRLIGNVVLESGLFSEPIVGFENHAGRTYLSEKYEPLGKVKYGKGNTGDSGYEGIIYKNVIATYLHGPLLPKNPKLCDYILEKALKRKYPDFSGLVPLDDELEIKGNKHISEKYI